MKKLHITLNGTSPLIEHSPKCVNPLHPIAKEMKLYTSKRKKTEEERYNIINDKINILQAAVCGAKVEIKMLAKKRENPLNSMQ